MATEEFLDSLVSLGTQALKMLKEALATGEVRLGKEESKPFIDTANSYGVSRQPPFVVIKHDYLGGAHSKEDCLRFAAHLVVAADASELYETFGEYLLAIEEAEGT